ncbi:putative ras GTP exchange factor son of sevenless [Fasciola gigantica]|uniref:Putative ras GTP exchange factor son of sevenless n=1 Tax=Fasciola gigantica TaxID=46835 RepID=A0A504YAZ9_FASGI|nr:putative ras GTP exchange factor son of sevenless [Fasciola gigantica]
MHPSSDYQTQTKHRMVFELRHSVEADNGDAYVEDYEKKLHKLNPSGLPFIEVGGKTQPIHFKLKHPNWTAVLNSTVTQPFFSSADSGDEASGAAATIRLLNFWKCCRIADLMEYYLSFQQTSYNFADISCYSPLSLGDKSAQLLENTSLPDFRTVRTRFAPVAVDSPNRAILPSLPPRPPGRRTGPPSSFITMDFVGAPVRRTASSVSPKFTVGSSMRSSAPQWDESHLDKAGSLNFTSPPCLPPRLHPPQTPSAEFAGSPALILSATVAPASVEAASVDPNRYLPPPSSPK